MSKPLLKGSYLLLLVQLIALTTTAQIVCQGSLGAPVINFDFGSGTANPGTAIPAATTSYTYVNNICPQDGNYTIAKSTNGCNTWHIVPHDHTGNTNGYFMLINASFSPGDFYKETLPGLCGNTTYEFTAWILNMTPPTGLCGPAVIKPDITFAIENTNGTILATYNTGNVPVTSTPKWQQFGFFFTTPPTASNVVVRMRNNAPGGCGNDLALDDIVVRPCGRMLNTYVDSTTIGEQGICAGSAADQVTLKALVSNSSNPPDCQWQASRDNGATWQDIPGANDTLYTASFPTITDTGVWTFRLTIAEPGNIGAVSCRTVSNAVTLTVNPTPALTVSGNSPLCTGDTLILSAIGTYAAQYQWRGPNNLSGTNDTVQIDSVTQLQAGKYHVTAISDKGCPYTDSSMTVTIYPSSSIEAGPDKEIFEGQSVQLNAAYQGSNVSYYWTPNAFIDNAQSLIPLVSPPLDTSYIFHISSDCGVLSDTVFIKVYHTVTPPNSFTPNGDGINDTWDITSLSFYTDADVAVFNRYGAPVFHSHGYSRPWDGTYNGKKLPAGTYFYVIDLKNGDPKLKGWVAILL